MTNGLSKSRFLTVQEVADLMRVSSMTVYRLIKAGELNALRVGKSYRLADQTATLVVRPRGWHLVEKHVTIDGAPVSASLFDFGLYFFHNARELLDRGTGPYFYLPKQESHL